MRFMFVKQEPTPDEGSHETDEVYVNIDHIVFFKDSQLHKGLVTVLVTNDVIFHWKGTTSQFIALMQGAETA